MAEDVIGQRLKFWIILHVHHAEQRAGKKGREELQERRAFVGREGRIEPKEDRLGPLSVWRWSLGAWRTLEAPLLDTREYVLDCDSEVCFRFIGLDTDSRGRILSLNKLIHVLEGLVISGAEYCRQCLAHSLSNSLVRMIDMFKEV